MIDSYITELLLTFSKTQNDAELQLGALARRKQLIIEELERCEKRAAEAIGKVLEVRKSLSSLESVARIEASCEEDNRYRKIAEVRSQAEFSITDTVILFCNRYISAI